MPDTPQDPLTPPESLSQQDTLEGRLAFLNLTPEDQERLQALLPLFRKNAALFAETFYKHLLRFPRSASLLPAGEQLDKLKKMQQNHFETMLQCDWSEGFMSDRRLVGHTHAQVGVDSKLFIGSFNQYLQFCVPSFFPNIPKESLEGILSLFKVVLLDLGLTLDAYFEQTTLKLRHALDMFWQANQELRQFAQLTTHDLKTPLATVANLCDEALDEFGQDMPPDAKELIAAARNRTFRMSVLIDELLANATATLSTENVEEIDTLQILRETAERLRPVFSEKRIELRLPSEMPRLLGNKIRLGEAFFNIFSNAAKFMDKSHGLIKVSFREEKGLCTLCIADNGPGIPANELERIFVPFRRLPTHNGAPGSGLGLYFTKNLIETQGGKIWAESEPYQGSRFCIQLKTSGPSPKK